MLPWTPVATKTAAPTQALIHFDISDSLFLSWWTETDLRTSLHQSDVPLGLDWSY